MKVETKLKQAIQGLLNKVNRVTSPHRHGQKVTKKDLDSLSDRQLETEQTLKEIKELGGGDV